MNSELSASGPRHAARNTAREAGLESAGRRVAAYLRHLPLPERVRHELALETLRLLAGEPDQNTAEIEARAMRILYSLLGKREGDVTAVPAPLLHRSHMKPEEMDRRPWVRALLRIWQPACSVSARIMNTSYADLVLYALLLACLYALI